MRRVALLPLCLLLACPAKPARPPIVAVTPEDDNEPEPAAPMEEKVVDKTAPTPPPAKPVQPQPPPAPPVPPQPAPEKEPAETAPPVTTAPQPATKPTKKPKIDPNAPARERALESLRVPFVAKQHIVYTVKDDVKESTGEFTVFPGRGYRLKITLPLGIVALDVQVRCNKYSYHVPLKLKHLKGPLSQAIKDIPYFPVAALFSIFDPTLPGSWSGRRFIAKRDRLSARVHKSLPAFVEWSVIDGNEQPITLQIAAFMPFEDGALLPQKMHFSFSDGRTIELEAESIARDVPSEDEVFDKIDCD